MNFLGVTLVSTKHYEGKVENSKHWRKMFEKKEEYCDKLVDDFYKREEKLKKQLKVSNDHLSQKTNLALEKQKKIEDLRAELKHSKNLENQAQEQIKTQAENVGLMFEEYRKRAAEFKRVVKCLRENVRARNIRIAKLKEGINIPAEIAKRDEKIQNLCMKSAKDRRTIYDLNKRVEAAKEYITKRKEADRLSTGR